MSDGDLTDQDLDAMERGLAQCPDEEDNACVLRLITEVRRLRRELEFPCDRFHVSDLSCSCGDNAASRGGDHCDSCPLSPAGIDRLVRDGA